jgi:hypothetical protein
VAASGRGNSLDRFTRQSPTSQRAPQYPAVPWSLALVLCAAMLAPGVAASADLPVRNVRVDADGGKSACPQGTTLDPKRTRAVLRRLRSHELGEGFLAALGRPLVVCYGNVPEGIVHTGRTVVLQEDHRVAANAARMGHLLHHLVHGLPFHEKAARTSILGCDDLVSKADLAHAVEVDANRSLA